VNGPSDKLKDGIEGSCARWMGPTPHGQKLTIDSTVADWMMIFSVRRNEGKTFMEHIFGNVLPNVH